MMVGLVRVAAVDIFELVGRDKRTYDYCGSAEAVYLFNSSAGHVPPFSVKIH
jgi:hypothetical protein